MPAPGPFTTIATAEDLTDRCQIALTPPLRVGLEVRVSYGWSTAPVLQDLAMTGCNAVGIAGVLHSAYTAHCFIDNPRRHDLGDGTMYYSYDLYVIAQETVDAVAFTYGRKGITTVVHRTTGIVSCPPGFAIPAAAVTEAPLARGLAPGAPATPAAGQDPSAGWLFLLVIAAFILSRKNRRLREELDAARKSGTALQPA